jgi:S-adenosylmethionine synthetase
MIKSAEFARCGHPDRVCDIMSDALVDEFLKQDEMSRVAIDVVGGHNCVYVIGEVSSKAYVDIPKVIKEVYREIGYKDEIAVIVNIVEQSPEIRDLANTGAGDSGIMVGYATRETAEMLPLEVVICKKVCDLLDTLPYLGPDGKVQATIDDEIKQYEQYEVEPKLKTLVVSVQSNEDYIKWNFPGLKLGLSPEEHLTNLLKKKFPCNDLRLTIFQKGGFDADSGLTGRKNILWYGPQVPTGGGAFAGKDPTKVDRSGAYYARFLAKKWLKDNPEEQEALVKIAFAIGKNEALMLTINGKSGKECLLGLKEYPISTTVSSILQELDLRKPIYKQASMLGHFGSNVLSWEK